MVQGRRAPPKSARVHPLLLLFLSTSLTLSFACLLLAFCSLNYATDHMHMMEMERVRVWEVPLESVPDFCVLGFDFRLAFDAMFCTFLYSCLLVLY